MSGYYRQPTVHGDTVVFVSEDDLWRVPLAGGTALRLTASQGAVATPCLAPDGKWIAFSAREEGAWEVYVMPANGGPAERLTFQGGVAVVVGWVGDGAEILYSSDADAPFSRARHLWSVPRTGGIPARLPWGIANHLSRGPGNSAVIGRSTGDPARWKRYRGGNAGQLWVDREGEGTFERINPVEGNITAPMWIGKRIYFIADHEGVGNLYSCTPAGRNVHRHTHHEDFYARGASTDGRTVVYHAGGDLYRYDIREDTAQKIPVDLPSPRVQRNRRYAPADKYLQGYQLRPDGKALALTARGKLFTMGNWEGPVFQHANEPAARARLCAWLNDGKRVVFVSDRTGEERLEIADTTGTGKPRTLKKIDIGHAMGLAVSPITDRVAVENHRFELIVADLASGKSRTADRSEFGPITGAAWSPDGQWIAYSFPDTSRTRVIRLYHAPTGKRFCVTRSEFFDAAPSWDPEGKYLYFLSFRAFNPVYDTLHFDLGFPKAMRIMVAPLRLDVPDPFVLRPDPPETPKADAEKDKDKEKDKEKGTKVAPIKIDTAGLTDRILMFPREASRYGRVVGLKGKLLYSEYPIRHALGGNGGSGEGRGSVYCFDLASMKEEQILTGVDGFSLSRNRAMLIYRSGKKLRVVKAGEKPAEQKANGLVRDGGKSTGWIDLDRIKVAVDPPQEWRQMFREAWRLQRDYFWDEKMSGVDWKKVYRRYEPLLERVSCRGELSDLLWEMQGELGTSHAYEYGGDYRSAPHMPQGMLGADLAWDARGKGYRIGSMIAGDSWDEDAHSPLLAPGTGVAKGDLILAINGQPLSKAVTPGHALVNRAGQQVALTVRRKKAAPRVVTVRALGGEQLLRYRAWVNEKRAEVHRRGGGQVGYVHIPDMGARGYAEFHRGWLPELHYPALIVDVRFNGGGHVSQLLLEKLARKRLGYDVARWHAPEAYPRESVQGPMVALTNDFAGSDGDIFCHCFKRMGLGPLIGSRTWGGVIGISPRTALVDGSVTTQPEFSFWFDDVEWGVENYGTDPDQEVYITPQDYKAGRDPQLEAGLEAILGLLKENPPALPPFQKRPARNLPRLPRRDGASGGKRSR
ncbi:MAG: PD40 domain-containing protein [Candidatus Hydrogenedentes bacterium]|nr:PD40 domain-containing protein [Candidatus Hydrogenedentota bacterium]